MAEKPRIKDTEQIFDSVGKRRERKTQPLIVQSDVLPPPVERPGEPDEEGGPAKRRGRPRKNSEAERPPEITAEQLLAAEERIMEDRNPLDFGKYELPQPSKRRGRPRKNAAAEEPAPQPEAAEPPVSTPRPEPRQQPVESVAPVEPEAGAEEPAPSPVAKAEEVQFAEFALEDFEEQQRQAERDRIRAEARRKREKALQQEKWEQEEVERLRKMAQEEADRARKAAEEEAERTLREAQEKAAKARKEAEEKARAAHEMAEREADRLHLEKESRRKLIEDDDYRDDVLGKLGDAFEQQFSKRFEEPEAVDEETPWWLEERREGLGKPIREPRPQQEPPPEEDEPATFQIEPFELGEFAPEEDADSQGEPLAKVMLDFPADDEEDVDADDFVEQFSREVRKEEQDQNREEDFRETLAQKFMRERERYLRDLGIMDQIEEDEQREAEQKAAEQSLPAPQQHRKLDLHILPEMHHPMGEGPEGPPIIQSTPVTYNRIAQVQPQEPVLPIEPGVPGTATVIAPDPGATENKKTAEQLLMELGEQNKRRTLKKAGRSTQFNFRFTTVGETDEDGEETGRKPMPMMTRIVLGSAAVGLVIIGLLAWAIAAALNPAQDILPGEDSAVINDDVDGVYTAYMNYNPDTMTKHADVVVKRSGLTLSNITVDNRLVVEEEATVEGSLTLSNVLVGEYIYIKNSGVNELDLKDVVAERVVINNDQQTVTVRTSGATDIGAIEIRTSANIEHNDLYDESPGIRAAMVVAPDRSTALTVGVADAKLATLSTEGETLLNFSDAIVDRLTADGDLNLSGTGKVTELNFGSNQGGGAAGGALAALPANLTVKGVEIGHINIKSPANVNLTSLVDSVACSDPVILGGNGSIGTLTFNEKFGNGRLSVDISGLNIQHLITNTEALINASGSSVINTLTANQSTYTLGNKVNMLRANADGVIYENEPDSRYIASGVTPPESKADNPQINYSLQPGFIVTTDEPASTDASEDDVASTCDHSRDAGGFILGDGSKSDPFVVETAAQLAHVSLHPDSHFVQGSDIDIAEDSSYADGFPAITARFGGTYDGAGYAIRNLRIYGDSESTGLFSENTGVIRNVNIASGEIAGSSGGYAAALVGMNYAGGVVESCSNGATINAENSTYAGGIVGYNYGGKVRDCYNTAKVSCDGNAGGIVGVNRQDGSVTGSYNIGVIEGEGSVGAIAGTNEAVVTNCYFLESEDLEGIGEGDGNVSSRDAEQLSSSQMAAELSAGNETSLWQTGGDGGYAYPTLRQPDGIVITSE